MNPTTPKAITEIVLAFCKEIDSSQEPMFTPVEPKENCRPFNCFENTISYQQTHGGSVQYGWIIWEAPNELLEAEFHAVWVSSDGKLIDVTPTIDGEGQILFLPDSKLRYENQLVDNIRKPLKDSFLTRTIVKNAEALFQIRKKHFKNGKVDTVAVKEELKEYRRQQVSGLCSNLHKVGRNEPCPCGSRKKYKKCCGS